MYPRKEINVYLKNNKSLSWVHNFKKNIDLVRIADMKKEKNFYFEKSRSSEFISEIKHICGMKTKKKYFLSRLKITNAIECMKIIKNFF